MKLLHSIAKEVRIVVPKEEMVHIIFREAETGRFAFHARWPSSYLEEIRLASSALNITLEEFIHRAFVEYLDA